jgi:hypothetical protein
MANAEPTWILWEKTFLATPGRILSPGDAPSESSMRIDITPVDMGMATREDCLLIQAARIAFLAGDCAGTSRTCTDAGGTRTQMLRPDTVETIRNYGTPDATTALQTMFCLPSTISPRDAGISSDTP